nr:DUF6514 family protein [uncultured Dysosmobacter sp.]
MRRHLVGAARCGRLPVRYYLLEGREGDGRRAYGILVEGGGDRQAVPSVTSSRQRAEALLAMLMRGRVTPTTARDVVEDWILT